MVDPSIAESELVRVQHAVVIQKGSDLRALNDLLSVGWIAVSTCPLGSSVLVILENTGTRETVEALRKALGYSELGDLSD